jgi:hypothetical protein
MESCNVRAKILSQIQHTVGSAIIMDRPFPDDEQLIQSEQLAVLEVRVYNRAVQP